MNATAGSFGARHRKWRLLYVVTEDWFFVTHFLPMARAALGAGFEVVVATNVRDHRAEIEQEGFRLVELRADRGSFAPTELLGTLLRLRSIIQRERPVLVHALALKSVILGGMAARLAHSPAQIHSITGLGYLWSSDRPTRRAARRLVRWLLRHFAKDAYTRFTFENPDDRRDLAFGERALVIGGWGVEANELSPKERARPPPLRAAFLGRMLRSKGVADAVEAVRRARSMGVQVELDLWGLPDEGNLTSLTTDELERLAAVEGVVWRGRAPSVDAVWRRAHVAILLGQREGMPRSLIEAAASGLPMIATDVPGCRSIVRDGVDGFLVPPGDPEAAARAMVTLATDETLRANMGSAARRGFECRFTTGVVVPKIVNLYLELAGRGELASPPVAFG